MRPNANTDRARSGLRSAAPSHNLFAPPLARTILKTAAGALLAAAIVPGAASAAVGGTHVIAALSDNSALELSGYPPSSTQAITVSRQGVTMAHGTATMGPVTDRKNAGAGAINGGGTDCWTDVTPDLMAGDVVQIGADTMTVEGVTSQRPVGVPLQPDTVVVHGTAADAAGNQLTGGTLEARIIPNGSFDGALKSIRAPAVYDGAGTAWTATFSGLSAADVNTALNDAKDSRGVFSNAAANETTISQNPVARGPISPCTAPFGQYAVTKADRAAVNAGNVGSDLVLSGASLKATAVSVSVADTIGNKTAAVPATITGPATGAQTWTATIPAASVAGLADGTLTASGSYVTATGTVTGATLALSKDLVAPPAPNAAPGPGTYSTAQSVTLSDADGAAIIRWTNGGTASASSPRADGPINVTGSQTISAVAVDGAGNVSPEASFGYVITPAAPAPAAAAARAAAGGAAGADAGAAPGAGAAAGRVPLAGAVAGQTPGVAVAGQRVSGFAVSRLAMARSLSRRQLRRLGLRATMQLPNGTKIVRITIVRLRNGRPERTPVAVRITRPKRAGLYRLQLRDRALLARLRPGQYVLQVKAGRSATRLGTTASLRFAITG